MNNLCEMEICNDICFPGKWINISYISDIYITNLQVYNTGLQERWAGVMDGALIQLSRYLYKGRIRNLIVLEVEDTPCLFLIGGK